jgi:hypothetical protein
MELTAGKQATPLNLKTEMLIEGHFDGETWGCCAIEDEGCSMFVSSGDDNTLLLYDVEKKRVVGRGTVEINASTTK